MGDPKSIHISDIRTFRSCRRKWQWSSPLHRNLESTVPYAPFFTGRAIHHALEMYYTTGELPIDAVQKFIISERDEWEKLGDLWAQEEVIFGEQVNLIEGLLGHYTLWVQQDQKKYSDRNLEFIALEQEFDVPFPVPPGCVDPQLRLGGRFDGIVRHRETGEYWIWETKTTRSIQELVKSLDNDEQCGTYMYAASQMFGHPIVGVLYNIMRKKVPTEPAMLASGLFSQNKSIDTTAFHYVQCIRDEYPNVSDEFILESYSNFLAQLLPNEQKFFVRWPVYRSKYMIDMLMEGLYHTAIEMVDPDTKLYPAPSWLGCNFCPFKGPCLAMNAGIDQEVLLEAEYQVRKSQKSIRTVEEGEAE